MSKEIETQQETKQWGSRFGYIMVAAGAAVGLGNIWKFPYLAYRRAQTHEQAREVRHRGHLPAHDGHRLPVRIRIHLVDGFGHCFPLPLAPETAASWSAPGIDQGRSRAACGKSGRGLAASREVAGLLDGGMTGAREVPAGFGGKYGGIAFRVDSGLHGKDGLRSEKAEMEFEMIKPSQKYSGQDVENHVDWQ